MPRKPLCWHRPGARRRSALTIPWRQTPGLTRRSRPNQSSRGAARRARHRCATCQKPRLTCGSPDARSKPSVPLSALPAPKRGSTPRSRITPKTMLWPHRFVISRNSSKSTFQALLVGSAPGNTRISPNAAHRGDPRDAGLVISRISAQPDPVGSLPRWAYEISGYVAPPITGQDRAAVAVFDQRYRTFRLSLSVVRCASHATVLAATLWWRWHINLGRPWGTQSGFTIADQKTPGPSSKKGSKKHVKTAAYMRSLKWFRVDGRAGFVAWDTAYPVPGVSSSRFIARGGRPPLHASPFAFRARQIDGCHQYRTFRGA